MVTKQEKLLLRVEMERCGSTEASQSHGNSHKTLSAKK